MSKLYLLDAGGVFIGTLEQFRDCFFSNATDELIANFASSQGYTLEVVNTENPDKWIDNYFSSYVGE